MGKEIYNIINDMAEVLNASQMQKLQEVLVNRLSENRAPDYLQTSNEEFLDMFLTAKHLEGCSDKTIRYYRCNIQRMLETVDVPVIKISTEMLRKYLVEYQSINNCGKVTIDNVRRSLSTFFFWLEEEDYIIKSPMKRIHKVKTAVVVKETLPDEKVEILRDNCGNLRDRAMIDFLLSTGIRVGELVRLNIEDIDFSERECVVYGKGDKECKAYFDAKTKLHLMNYIESRTDNNKALFVSLNRPHDRLTESGVELRLREMGKKLGVEKVHPHKFRRTMATRAIEKGMPIEQVQKILGHEQIDTTLRYAMVNQNNVKLSHRKYMIESIFHRLTCNAKNVTIKKNGGVFYGKNSNIKFESKSRCKRKCRKCTRAIRDTDGYCDRYVFKTNIISRRNSLFCCIAKSS